MRIFAVLLLVMAAMNAAADVANAVIVLGGTVAGLAAAGTQLARDTRFSGGRAASAMTDGHDENEGTVETFQRSAYARRCSARPYRLASKNRPSLFISLSMPRTRSGWRISRGSRETPRRQA